MNQTRKTIEIDPSAAYRTSAIIAFALFLGPGLFAIVALLVRHGAGHTSFDSMTILWVAFTAATIVAARFVWMKLVGPQLPRRGWRAEPMSAREAGQLQTGLIVTWALLEGASLFGLVAYQVAGSYITLAGALALLSIGLLASRPRRAYFGLR